MFQIIAAKVETLLKTEKADKEMDEVPEVPSDEEHPWNVKRREEKSLTRKVTFVQAGLLALAIIGTVGYILTLKDKKW